MPSCLHKNVGAALVDHPEQVAVDSPEVRPLERRHAIPKPTRNQVPPIVETDEIMPQFLDRLLDVLGDRQEMRIVVTGKKYFHHHKYYRAVAVPGIRVVALRIGNEPRSPRGSSRTKDSRTGTSPP